MVRRERSFEAPASDGNLVGSVRESPGAPANAVLLHGGPGMNDYLEPLAGELDGVVTTARYQQRGLAPSATAGEASVEQHVADAMSVITALGWDKPVVIGHSWGGYLAMQVAAAHPSAISALVIIDALGAVDGGGQKQFGPALRRNLDTAQMARLEELEEIEEPTQEEMREHLGILWPNYFGDPAGAPPMPYMEFAENSAQTWASIQSHFRKGTLARKLPRVTVPAVVIHGELSPIPLIQGRRIAELMPNARLAVVPGGGHWPWLERPGFVRSQVEELLART